MTPARAARHLMRRHGTLNDESTKTTKSDMRLPKRGSRELGVVAYIVGPIDLIPDVVPLLGYLDDLILVPAGIAPTGRKVPSPILLD